MSMLKQNADVKRDFLVHPLLVSVFIIAFAFSCVCIGGSHTVVDGNLFIRFISILKVTLVSPPAGVITSSVLGRLPLIYGIYLGAHKTISESNTNFNST